MITCAQMAHAKQTIDNMDLAELTSFYEGMVSGPYPAERSDSNCPGDNAHEHFTKRFEQLGGDMSRLMARCHTGGFRNPH